MELPPVESWPNDNCIFAERGKVLTKISNKTCCFQACHRKNWHLCYIIRTTDDALIIFTAPEKGFVLNLSSALYLKIARKESSTGKRMCTVKVKWRFGKVKLKFAESQIFTWRQRFLSTFGQISEPNKSATASSPKNQKWDSTNSMTSLTGNYTSRSQSSKLSGSLKNIDSVDMENTESPSTTSRKTQFCNCQRLLNLIKRDDTQYPSKAQLQNNPMNSMSSRSIDQDSRDQSNPTISLKEICKINNSDEVSNGKKINCNPKLSKPSESNA
uniref:PH domain-containing protein n=1 Tax=Setaria digitata TaxID=48799 RepID=A0A915PWA9_9BILA